MKCFKGEDGVLSELATLYERRGYRRYKPGFYEDYSLYLENIDFLISKNVITFSGAEGRLLALRPDVTLSIISHSREDEGTQKLFYSEKVYRRADGGGEFREINQTGVEVIGEIDTACQAEVGCLVCDTLATVSNDYIVDLSHMGYTEGLMSRFNIPAVEREHAYACLHSKNVHDFSVLAHRCSLDDSTIKLFSQVASIGGNAQSAITLAKECASNAQMVKAAEELEKLIATLTELGYGDKISVNFSIEGNADYYNGIVFNGYLNGVPRRVLSGGRYDKLLLKLGKKGGAIGFALYLGELERYFKADGNFVDALIIYDDKSQLTALKESEKLLKKGKSVRISREAPQGLRFGTTIDLTEGKND